MIAFYIIHYFQGTVFCSAAFIQYIDIVCVSYSIILNETNIASAFWRSFHPNGILFHFLLCLLNVSLILKPKIHSVSFVDQENKFSKDHRACGPGIEFSNLIQCYNSEGLDESKESVDHIYFMESSINMSCATELPKRIG